MLFGIYGRRRLCPVVACLSVQIYQDFQYLLTWGVVLLAAVSGEGTPRLDVSEYPLDTP